MKYSDWDIAKAKWALVPNKGQVVFGYLRSLAIVVPLVSGVFIIPFGSKGLKEIWALSLACIAVVNFLPALVACFFSMISKRKLK